MIKNLKKRRPKIHKLKTLAPFFEAVARGDKSFECRKFDRDYRIGDTLLLREWTGKKYTGRTETITVSYILSDPAFGTQPGWCVMGFSDVPF